MKDKKIENIKDPVSKGTVSTKTFSKTGLESTMGWVLIKRWSVKIRKTINKFINNHTLNKKTKIIYLNKIQIIY